MLKMQKDTFFLDTRYWMSKKTLSFRIFSIIKTTENKILFTAETTDKVPSLSKFWRNLVDVKIVKIRHLIDYKSYINQNMKNMKNIFL